MKKTILNENKGNGGAAPRKSEALAAAVLATIVITAIVAGACIVRVTRAPEAYYKVEGAFQSQTNDRSELPYVTPIDLGDDEAGLEGSLVAPNDNPGPGPGPTEGRAPDSSSVNMTLEEYFERIDELREANNRLHSQINWGPRPFQLLQVGKP